MEKELVAGLIIRGSRLLLVRNIKYGGLRVEPPGGKVEPGEGRESALRREVGEETGLKVKRLDFFGIFETDSPEGSFKVFTYLCLTEEGEPRITEPEKIAGFGWYTFSGLKGLSESGLLVPNMVAALEKLKKYLL